jgi:hypothetical protein
MIIKARRCLAVRCAITTTGVGPQISMSDLRSVASSASRLIVDGDRPRLCAIRRIDRPAAIPREIFHAPQASTPPQLCDVAPAPCLHGEPLRWTPVLFLLSSPREIANTRCPFFQRSHSSVFCFACRDEARLRRTLRRLSCAVPRAKEHHACIAQTAGGLSHIMDEAPRASIKFCRQPSMDEALPA